ncbi:MAG: protein MltB [Deltaproteobacteria bacterium]|nr:MAG: protein MltB [Deltaproteobacteria bacterium]
MPVSIYRLRRILLCICVWTLGLALVSAVQAASLVETPYGQLEKRLAADGFDPAWLKTLFTRPEVHFNPKRVSGYFAHNESKLNYDQFLTPYALNRARKFVKKHQALLSRAEADYQVPGALITAIFLVETSLGAYTGSNRVFNTLAAMAALSDARPRQIVWQFATKRRHLSRKKFTKKAARKSAWAYTELTSLLTLCRKEGLDPLAIKGSYAGAIGIPQFIPSRILQLGVDGDHDGHVNLFQLEDAIPSTANYLRHFGWKPGIDMETAQKVLYAYNHSTYYVRTLLKAAKQINKME